MNVQQNNIKKTGQIRVIAGLWRGKKINFPPNLHIRPTPDRVKETLFNWLMYKIRGACCLDLFAGSGALGFEALSRGAANLSLIDHSALVIKHLKKTVLELKHTDIEIIESAIPNYSLKFHTKFDIVFLDPPFYRDLIEPCVHWLESCCYLNTGAHVYIESEKNTSLEFIPINWTLIKEGQAGIVKYQLFQV